MKLFDITESNSQLAVTKRKPTQLLHTLLLGGIAIFFGSGLWDALHRSLDFWIVYAVIIAIILFGVLAFQLPSQLLVLLRGETWTFDIKRGVVERNGKFMGDLSQMYSIRAWEEGSGEDATQRLAIQPTGGKPLILSTAFTANDWDELVNTGRKIADFTGIRFVRK